MNVQEMLERTSSAELTEWIAYEQLHGPLGPRRTDMLLAQLCAVVANSNRGKGGRKSTAEDFLPDWGRKQRTQGWEHQKSIAQSLNAAFGGTVDGQPRDGRPRDKRRRPSRVTT